MRHYFPRLKGRAETSRRDQWRDANEAFDAFACTVVSSGLGARVRGVAQFETRVLNEAGLIGRKCSRRHFVMLLFSSNLILGTPY